MMCVFVQSIWRIALVTTVPVPQAHFQPEIGHIELLERQVPCQRALRRARQDVKIHH